MDVDPYDCLPDFIVRLTNGVHPILETKGHDPLEEVTAQAARRWGAAANAEGSYGEWRYARAHRMASLWALS